MANLPPCPQPSYNTYIGARYVPIFAGTWDKTKTYEPLTIVEYQGNSYTSKTFVPANVDITNETYWSLTGNYNAQVEAYRKEVQSVAGQLDSIETDITELSYVTNVNYFKGKRVLILGDSLSDTNATWNPNLQPNWVTNFISKMGNVCASITNNSKSGRRVSDTNPNTDIPGLCKIIDTIKLDDYDIVLFFVGINDVTGGVPLGIYYNTDQKTFWGALNHIRDVTLKSSAVCYFISPLFQSGPLGDWALPMHTVNMYRYVIYLECIASGWHYIDGYNTPLLAGNTAKWTDDGKHYLNTYSPYLADYIIKSIQSGQHTMSTPTDIIAWNLYPEAINTENFTNLLSWIMTPYTNQIQVHMEGRILNPGLIYTFPTDLAPVRPDILLNVVGHNIDGTWKRVTININQTTISSPDAPPNTNVTFDFSYSSNMFWRPAFGPNWN